ncbi:hypothetical protein EVAR_27088_1 [Eumeta japonica]|uniref:Uncharacterized protein n=1 Tax=Eumeta variegata TaxID=151549 RepID=A0A4C1VJ45_EUMVA|nr:hypothetical protein EVAR_27088_1 [Eumeta japonica]
MHTYRELKVSLGISDEFWIYAYDSESKQQSTVWVFQDEPNPTKVIHAKSRFSSREDTADTFKMHGLEISIRMEKVP